MTDRQTDKQTDRRVDRQKSRQTERQTTSHYVRLNSKGQDNFHFSVGKVEKINTFCLSFKFNPLQRPVTEKMHKINVVQFFLRINFLFLFFFYDHFFTFFVIIKRMHYFLPIFPVRKKSSLLSLRAFLTALEASNKKT